MWEDTMSNASPQTGTNVSGNTEEMTSASQFITNTSQNSLSGANSQFQQMKEMALDLPTAMQNSLTPCLDDLRKCFVDIATVQAGIGTRLALTAEQFKELDTTAGQAFNSDTYYA
jgi:hypothetical protein